MIKYSIPTDIRNQDFLSPVILPVFFCVKSFKYLNLKKCQAKNVQIASFTHNCL